MPSKKKLKRKLAEARNDAAYWQEMYELAQLKPAAWTMTVIDAPLDTPVEEMKSLTDALRRSRSTPTPEEASCDNLHPTDWRVIEPEFRARFAGRIVQSMPDRPGGVNPMTPDLLVRAYRRWGHR